jgi:exodeoxyribonuclease VII small subunit
MSPKKPAPEAAEPIRFEDALTRLEAIVQELEGKDLSLEDTLARYEEGSRLVRECAQRLEEAEQRIRTLSAAEGPQAGGEDVDEAEEDEGEGLPF